MIIKIDDSNRASYINLFTEAYQKLVENGVITEVNDAGRFTSLEELFNYIEELVQLDKTYYIKLPLDEPALAIDANTRTITVPANFAKCAAVQSDQIAETVIFTIDRFYDYMDLMNAQVWVQWIAPNKDGSSREGATFIELKDIDSLPGKIRFGWPLDADITAVPGKVQFAVRFFIKENIDGKEKVVYSLNTLPAVLTVQAALQPELNDEHTINRPNSLFGYAVRNNKYPGQGVAAPQVPTFAAPGMNLPINATLTNDTLTLMAQAVVGDAGMVSYEWYYTSVDGNTTRPCKAYVDENGTSHDAFGTIGVAYKKTDAKKRVLSDDYYSVNGTLEKDAEGNYLDVYYYKPEDAAAFIIYNGNVENADVDLYEKYTTYTVPTTGPVTGTYQVKAVNKIYPNESQPVGSQPCRLISPSDVNITKDLPAYAVMDPNAKLTISAGKLAEDPSELSYYWQMTDNIAEDMEIIADAASLAYVATAPGWYQVGVTSNLNRETREVLSSICKVTNLPKAPTVDYDKDKTTGDYDKDNDHSVNADPGDELVFAVKASVSDAGDASTYGENNLYSEGLTYKWYLSKTDSMIYEAEITAEDISGGAIDEPMIKVILQEDAKDAPYRYTCKVTNHLSGETATTAIDFRAS